MRHRFVSALLSCLLAWGLTSSQAHAGQYDVVYGGRLVDATSGSPVTGPIDAQIKIFASQSDTTALQTFSFSQVSLVDGVFSLKLALSKEDWDALLGNRTTAWVEFCDSTHGRSYPRQELSATPFALKALTVPVDGTTVQFVDGKLAVKPAGLSLGGDVTGVPSANKVVSLQGKPISNSPPSTGEYLKWDGTAWVPAGVSGAAGGTVTSVTADAPFSVSASSSTPHLSLTGTIPADNIHADIARKSDITLNNTTITALFDTKYLQTASVPVCAAGQFLSKGAGGAMSCAAPPAPTSDAAALTSGTLSDARLSSNVSLLGSTIANGELQGMTGNCAAGKVLEADGAGGFTCADDNDTYTSGAALTTALGSTYVKPGDLPVCAAGQFLSKAANGSLSCGAPPAPTSDASALTTGTLSDARLSANVSLLGQTIGAAELENGGVTTTKIADGNVTVAKLTNACASGQVLKSNGTGGFVCSTDDNTYANGAALTTALDATYLRQANVPVCAAGEFLTKGAGGAITCSTPIPYATGTWTPAISYTTPGTLAVTYQRQTGRYTRVGNLVTVNFDIRITSFTKGTASGHLIITGIPFPVRTGAGYDNSYGTLVVHNGLFSSPPFVGTSTAYATNALFLIRAISGSNSTVLDDPTSGVYYFGLLTYETP